MFLVTILSWPHRYFLDDFPKFQLSSQNSSFVLYFDFILIISICILIWFFAFLWSIMDVMSIAKMRFPWSETSYSFYLLFCRIGTEGCWRTFWKLKVWFPSPIDVISVDWNLIISTTYIFFKFLEFNNILFHVEIHWIDLLNRAPFCVT